MISDSNIIRITFPVTHFSLKKDRHIAGASVNTLYALVKDIDPRLGSQELSNGDCLTAANPRPDWHKSPIREEVLGTFQCHPQAKPGYTRNAGVVLLAERVTYDEGKSAVTIEFDRSRVEAGEQGTGDGLTTVSTLIRHKDEIHPEQELKLEAYCGFGDGREIILKRNSKKALSLPTKLSYDGSLDLLRSLAEGAGLKDQISFREGDGGRVQAAVLIQQLGIAHPNLSPKPSTSFYSSHEGAFARYKNSQADFAQYDGDTVKNVLLLSDFIQVLMQPQGPEKKHLIETRKGKKPDQFLTKKATLFYPGEIANADQVKSLCKGYHFALLFAICRYGIDIVDDKVTLKYPLPVLKDRLTKLRKELRGSCIENNKKSDVFGKDASEWNSLRLILQ